MLRIEYVYWLCGALFSPPAPCSICAHAVCAQAAFWAILSACFFGGDTIEAAAAAGNALPAQVGGHRGDRTGADRRLRQALKRRAAERRCINFIAIDAPSGRAASATGCSCPPWSIPFVHARIWCCCSPICISAANLDVFDTRQTTLTALAVACVIAALAAMALTRATPLTAVARNGSRLLDALSWAALLPMLLATLGARVRQRPASATLSRISSRRRFPTDSRLRLRARLWPSAWRCSRSSWATRSPPSR